ncbi:nuclear transport factor 2 family protein [Aerosakkonema sp. BLCC-F183]|uniref:nuclear transport factor 2 family protein n=1 Tax=Aerosakkonema sp. BLCC-F183 TaxID=3342834 RepID=UPI0035B9A24D
MTEDLLAKLTDRAKIIEVVNQYGLAIDLRNWELLHNVFANPVEVDYSSIGIPVASFQPEEMVNAARQDLSGLKATQHQITNHSVEISDDTATCVAHVSAMHFLPNDQGDNTFEMGGYYIAGLIRIGSDWKIKQWKFAVLWNRGNNDIFRLAKNA